MSTSGLSMNLICLGRVYLLKVLHCKLCGNEDEHFLRRESLLIIEQDMALLKNVQYK